MVHSCRYMSLIALRNLPLFTYAAESGHSYRWANDSIREVEVASVRYDTLWYQAPGYIRILCSLPDSHLVVADAKS